MSETWDLRPDGLRFWELVKEGPLLVRPKPLSYYYRLIQSFFLGALVLVAASLLVRNTNVLIGCELIVILALGGSVWWYWTRERPFASLMALISDEAIHIGCERDEILIPWTAVDTDATYLPVNNSFMVIPVSRTRLESILFLSGEDSTPWDRKAYRRAYLTIRYNPDMSWIEVAANPNGFFVDILTVVYPMLGIWRERQMASADKPSAGESR